MHELLIAAGPPPAGEMPEPIRTSATVVPFRRRRLRVAGLAAVAAAVLLALGGGYLLGTRGERVQLDGESRDARRRTDYGRNRGPRHRP